MRSYRRILLDADLEESRQYMKGIVLDIGGGRKRGEFKVPDDVTWIVLDVNKERCPCILGDAGSIPVKSNTVDCVKCTELLEHVEHPEVVLNEITRVLKPGGTLILSIPFNLGIHADPYDYQRFTDQKLERMLEGNFHIQTLKKQGLYFTVIADMIRQGIVNSKRGLRLVFRPLLPMLNIMVKLDNLTSVRNSKIMNAFTTGFFVIATKRE